MRHEFAPTHGSVVRLLLVDESIDELVRARDLLLRHPGIHVHGVRDASEAPALVEQAGIDAVLVDIAGWDRTRGSLARTESGLRPMAPAIVMYGPGDEERVAEAMRSGASGAIERRVFFDGDAVVRRVREALSAVRAARRKETLALWLEREARFDHLTGLVNQGAFDDRIREFGVDGSCRDQPVSLIVMDIEGLGVVNRVFGHGVGDELLRRASGAIARCIRAGDTAARVGGDEMAILVPYSGMDVAQMLARRIGHEVERLNSEPAELPPLTVTFSVASGRTAQVAAVFAAAMAQVHSENRRKAPVLAAMGRMDETCGPGVA